MTVATTDGHPSRWWAGPLLVALLAVVGPLVVAAPAVAHTTLVASDPAADAALDAPPAALRLTFSEDVLPQFVQVRLTVDDAAAEDLRARAEGAVVTAVVPDEDRSGSARWRVDYRVVADDGHPVTGTLEFTVARGPGTTTGPTTTGATQTEAPGPTEGADAAEGRGPWLLPVSLTALVLVAVAAGIAERRRRPPAGGARNSPS